MLKVAIKHASDVDMVRHPTPPPQQVTRWATKLEELNDEVAAILKDEKEEKAICQAEMELNNGENMIEHEKEIFSRPTRTWFQSEKGKLNAKGCAGHVLRCPSFLIPRTYREFRPLI